MQHGVRARFHRSRLRLASQVVALVGLVGLAAAGAQLGCRRDAGAPSGSGSSAPSGSAASGSAPAAPTQRVVSLSPSATEVMAALGATPMLVGVDDYSAFPAEVSR